MNERFPVWRSMLFVPAHVDKFVSSAHTRGADAYILDLEDSVPLEQKGTARARLPDAATSVSRSGASVLVRINADATLVGADLEAAVRPEVHALLVPKVGSGVALLALDQWISQLEKIRGVPPGQILLIAQIEDVHALAQMDEISRGTPRIMGLILGSEDFSHSAGMEPTEQNLFGPNQQLVFACKRNGIHAFGFPGSISQFRDPDAFRRTIRLARHMGFVGSYAIHPDQVAIMNEEYLPTAEELTHAREMLAAYEVAKAGGRGAFEFRGRMIDPPVLMRAQEIVRRSTARTSPESAG